MGEFESQTDLFTRKVHGVACQQNAPRPSKPSSPLQARAVAIAGFDRYPLMGE